VELRLDDDKNGVRERVGTIVGRRGEIPAALWTPSGGLAKEIVLIGHGASATKLEDYVVALARRLVREFSIAAVAIDGPVHGERRVDGEAGERLQGPEFAQLWSNDPSMTDRMVEDWRDALDAALALDDVASEPAVGYWGLSMGTILGLPLVAAEPRISACVLGLMGTTGPTKSRIIDDAERVTVPTMYLLQWDDQLFSRADGFALFDLLATKDKTLIATPGAHAEVTQETFRRTAEFLADRLGATRR
jgi:pimeloyl-ACP methyl ester carboxylesterase